jgi:hypothetical protein
MTMTTDKTMTTRFVVQIREESGVYYLGQGHMGYTTGVTSPEEAAHFVSEEAARGVAGLLYRSGSIGQWKVQRENEL